MIEDHHVRRGGGIGRRRRRRGDDVTIVGSGCRNDDDGVDLVSHHDRTARERDLSQSLQQERRVFVLCHQRPVRIETGGGQSDAPTATIAAATATVVVVALAVTATRIVKIVTVVSCKTPRQIVRIRKVTCQIKE